MPCRYRKGHVRVSCIFTQLGYPEPGSVTRFAQAGDGARQVCLHWRSCPDNKNQAGHRNQSGATNASNNSRSP